MNFWDDDDDSDAPKNTFDMNIEEYANTIVNKSESDYYVLISYTETGDIYVVDKGSLPFCIDRLKCVFELCVNQIHMKNGLSIVPVEDFWEMVSEDE